MTTAYGQISYPGQIARPRAVAREDRVLLWLAALPAGIGLFLPYGRIRLEPFYFYYHDIFTVVFLLFAAKYRVRKNTHQVLNIFSWILIGAFFVGFFVSLIMSGASLRLFLYTFEYTIYIYYAKRVYELVRGGHLNLRRYATIISYFALLNALFGVIQYLLTIISPSLSVGFTNAFHKLFFIPYNFSSVVRRWQRDLVRIVGTWEVAVDYAGMMVCSVPIVLISGLKSARKIFILACIVTAIVLTGTRHAWLSLLGLLMIYIFYGFSFKKAYYRNILGLLVILAIVYLLVSAMSGGKGRLAGADDILEKRIEHTRDRGMEDVSVSIRLFKGPQRFFAYLKENPLIFFVGLGQGDEAYVKSVGMKVHEYRLQSGFVSNSWLLILRGNGIFAFIGLLGIHLYLLKRRYRKPEILAFVAMSACILFAGNYAYHMVRCWRIIMLTVFIGWMLLPPIARARP